MLEHRVVARYMALMLTGQTSDELGGRAIVHITCQGDDAVDDVILLAQRANETEPSLRLAIASRRAPDLVPTDPKSQKLITAFVRQLLTHEDDETLEHRIGMVVAGHQPHGAQMAMLAAQAEAFSDPGAYFRLINAPKKFDRNLRTRLTCLTKMVAAALRELTSSEPDSASVQRHVLTLFKRLTVIALRLEAPDTHDWDDLPNRLIDISRDGTLQAAENLAEHLETLAGQWVPRAADFDVTLLRRKVHHLINADAHRRTAVWTKLALLEQLARRQVRTQVAASETAAIRLTREEPARDLIAKLEADWRLGLIVRGESGVGKSALTIAALTRHVAADPGQTQVLCLNLERLPTEPVDLLALLGSPLIQALRDLSAPHRYLVIDGADAVARRHRAAFRDLIASAREAEVAVIAVVSDPAFAVVRDAMAEQLGVTVPDFTVPPLTDEELDALAVQLPPLARLLMQRRSRELLRRLVVIDLLMRSNTTGPVLSDLDALRQVWNGLVRRSGDNRGGPTARVLVMVKLARRELSGETSNAVDFLASLDTEALDTLIDDGLLLSVDAPLGVSVPMFAHDEIRRYAVAQVLIEGGRPAQTLLGCGAVRWAMPAARLACQAVFEAAGRERGTLQQAQAEFDALADAHGRRWADVPAEALLACRDSRSVLADGWPHLRERDWFGVHRLCRLVQQYRKAGGIVDTAAVEPVIALLLQEERPWLISREVRGLLVSWLCTLTVREEPAGHALRRDLLARLVAYCDAGEQEMRERQADDRSGETNGRAALLADVFAPRTRSGRRVTRPEVPRHLTDETTVELLALLGADMGEQGSDLLRRLARDAPHHLAPALESLGAARGVNAYDYGLLAELTLAYYVDDAPLGMGMFADGVRHHEATVGRPLAAWYYGPFVVLLRWDFRAGCVVINRLLNHAVRFRVDPQLLADDGRVADLPEQVAEDVALHASLLPGRPGVYLGDYEVWRWYRGCGKAPYPCISALMALERQSDELVAAGVPLARIREALLEDCENLAVPALLLDLLTRHIEHAGELIDPFLGEPAIWDADLERRAVQEISGTCAQHEVAHPERRTWTLTDTAMFLTLHADPARAVRLRQIRRQVIDAVAQEIEQTKQELGEDWSDEHQRFADEYTARVETRTGALDRDRFTFERAERGIRVSAPPALQVDAVLEPTRSDLARGSVLQSIHNRYHIAPSLRPGQQDPLTTQQIVDDIEVVRALLADPPEQSSIEPWDVAAEVAASALREHLLSGTRLPAETLRHTVALLLAAAEGARAPMQYDGRLQTGAWLADRSAARGLPLLLLPQATGLLTTGATTGKDADAAIERLKAGCARLAGAAPLETRLFLARALDPVWDAGCVPDQCPHRFAFELVGVMLSDCLLGPDDRALGRRRAGPLGDATGAAIGQVRPEDIDVHALGPAIRAAAFAATSASCVQAPARELIDALLDAHRRTLTHEPGYDHHGELALGASRAVLRLAHAGDDLPVRRHIAQQSHEDELLDNTLRGLAAVAEETPWASATARRVWPDLVRQVTGITRLHAWAHPGHMRYTPLASVLPRRSFDTEFVHRELTRPPLEWRDLRAWRDSIEEWLTPATGNPECVDALIGLLRTVPAAVQAELGLPWIADMVLARPAAMTPYARALPGWLITLRTEAEQLGDLSLWQRVVDELVVAGCRQLAGYAE